MNSSHSSSTALSLVLQQELLVPSCAYDMMTCFAVFMLLVISQERCGPNRSALLTSLSQTSRVCRQRKTTRSQAAIAFEGSR
ncbi:hypothetical protein Y032_0032g2598 [Ancylostoma ceylanicum]|uniref:Uncharacterized protein n=1 Tax=Ancylostoma ceylanicum TaxID=53326 RepID=A0A016UPY1_9BILA|nr:hypothetical protein Y032_0032g2598 [Ancylostoma ceylanicum]